MIKIKIPNGSIDVMITSTANDIANGNYYGRVQGAQSSLFVIQLRKDYVQGKIVINRKDGYIFSTDLSTQEVFVKSVDINTLICTSPASSGNKNSNTNDFNDGGVVNRVQPVHSSNPAATFVLFLDFDGGTTDSMWSGDYGNTYQSANYTDAKIKAIWAGVAEKYRPYNVNVTTDQALYDSATSKNKQSIVYTSNQSADGGGIASIGSVSSDDTNICWVFINQLNTSDLVSLAHTGSHEAGHAFNLQHDAESASDAYYDGHGKWVPIMGNNALDNQNGRTIVQWSKGEYQNAVTHGGGPNVQQDVQIIADQTRGGVGVIGYRTDEDSNTIASARPLDDATGTVTGTTDNGIITNKNDKDYFVLNTAGGTINITIQSSTKTTANEGTIDIQARLLDSSGTELAIYNSTGYVLDATINRNVPAGTYYIEIDGVGEGNPLNTGYSDYGSIGYYQMSGSYPPGSTTNPPNIVSLTAAPTCNSYTFQANVTGVVDSLLWEFGDGTTSTVAVATHAYTLAGSYIVKLTVTNSYGSDTDQQVVNVTLGGIPALNLSEGFESTFLPTGWLLNNPDSSYTWEKSTAAGYNSSSCVVMNNADYTVTGQIDEMTIPNHDLSQYTNLSLNFYVAYTKFDTVSADVLRVYVSKDCGTTWTEEYMKTHTDLETVSVGGGNAANNWVPSTTNDWRKETIDLANYAGEANVMFKFHNTNQYGSRIWIDDINLDGVLSVDSFENAASSLFIYPNPTNGIVNLNFNSNSDNRDVQITVIDMLGRVVYKEPLGLVPSNYQKSIDLSRQSKGVYLVQVNTSDKTITKKIVVN